MLYRNPEPVHLPVFHGPFRRVFAALRLSRRRRRNTIEVLALSPHRRRDLGLETFPFD